MLCYEQNITQVTIVKAILELAYNHLKQYIEPILVECPALNQHWAEVSCLLSYYQTLHGFLIIFRCKCHIARVKFYTNDEKTR